MSKVKVHQKHREMQKQKEKPVNPLAARMGLTNTNRAILENKPEGGK